MVCSYAPSASAIIKTPKRRKDTERWSQPLNAKMRPHTAKTDIVSAVREGTHAIMRW
ncbi:MAG: hypothetical protein KIT45_03805 [Fimbriimonadia bacterium]|nr:hypothetical protein [Fimbriimonadia bacterium]